MKKLLSLIALSLIFSAMLSACGINPAEEQEVIPVEQEQNLDVTGAWNLVINHNGGTIQNTVYIYPLGLAQTVDGLVTTPEGLVANPNITGAYWAHYEVDGHSLVMNALNGSSTSEGILSNENNATGTITSAAGTYSWNATKIGDLPAGSEIYGYWMMHIDGWGEGEFARFQSLYLNADGTADTNWIKVQANDGNVNEGEIPDYLSTFTYEDGVVFIESENGDVTFQGTYAVDDDGAEVLSGVWHNSATNETGTFEAVKMD